MITYNSKPRVLFVSHSGQFYGAERSLLTLLVGLRDMDRYEILVWVPEEGPLTAALSARDLSYRVLPYSRWIGQRFHPVTRYFRRFRNRLMLSRLLRTARKWKPDIVYTNTIATPAGAFITEHLHPRPLHVWHARELPGSRDTAFGLFDLEKSKSFKIMARTADAFICNSQFLRDRLEPLLAGANAPAPSPRIEVIYNGIDEPGVAGMGKNASEMAAQETTAPKRYTPKRNSQDIRIVMAGGISKVKNFEDAIAATGRMKEMGYPVRLEIFGEGSASYVKKLEKEIINSGMEDQIEMMGYREDMGAVFSQSDLLLITSRMETFGRVAVEAMLAGCPVISSDAGALPEIVRDGETGLMYPTGDVDQLVQQICRLLESPGLRKSLIHNARGFARTNYSTGPFVDQIHAVLQNLLQ
ncbi:MAG: glycosyltransferase family 4 protein, partial [Cyclonatronaceae bacterium]